MKATLSPITLTALNFWMNIIINRKPSQKGCADDGIGGIVSFCVNSIALIWLPPTSSSFSIVREHERWLILSDHKSQKQTLTFLFMLFFFNVATGKKGKNPVDADAFRIKKIAFGQIY